MNDEAPSATAGWYPSAANDGTERYWDGAQWSEESRYAAPTASPPPAPKAGKKEIPKRSWIALGVVALVVFIGLVSGDGGDDDGGGEFGARDVCEQFVESRLKSPSTADFSSTSASGSTTGTWTVRGNVDSQNSFGATVRNSYTCVVRHTSGGDWTLVDLTTSSN